MSQSLYDFDQSWREKGYQHIAGIDEAGRGPWAGPVCAASVILKPDNRWPELNDSKKLNSKTREKLFDAITKESLFYAVALADPCVIDELNILQATFQAMRQALSQLNATPDLVLIDGRQKLPGCPTPQQPVIKGDAQSASIAAASILAKVTRDRIMAEAHKKFPVYDFITHKGYGTPAHQKALQTHGPCHIHRRSFAPIKLFLTTEGTEINREKKLLKTAT